MNVGSIWRDTPEAFSYTRSIRHVAGQSSSERTRVIIVGLYIPARQGKTGWLAGCTRVNASLGACVIDVLPSLLVPSFLPLPFLLLLPTFMIMRRPSAGIAE